MHRIVIKPQAITQVCKSLGGISRDELSRRMNVSTVTAYRVDAAKCEPGTRFIAALMDVSGQKFEDLFDIELLADERVPA